MKQNPPEVTPAIHTGEISFYEAPGILVTDARLVISGKTFVLANITAVESTRLRPNDSGNGFLMLVGVIIAIVGAFTLKADISAGSGIILVGVILVAAVQLHLNARKPRFALIVETNSGRESALESEDQHGIARVATAVNDALATGRRVRPDRL